MSEREEVPFFISRLRDETDEAWVHTTLSGEAFLIEDILNVYDEQQETIIVLRAQLTTAERERDEARRERDAALDLAKAECDSNDTLRHRAERAERVVEAARAFSACQYMAYWSKTRAEAEYKVFAAVRALDAAEGT